LWLSHDLDVLDKFKAVVGFGHVYRLRKRWATTHPNEAAAALDVLSRADRKG